MLVTERVEESLAQGDYLVEAGGSTTTIKRLSDGKRWPVNAARGRNVLLSPDQQRIAWSITNDDLPPDQQVAAVWIANLDGSGARQVAALRRGSLSGWISEDALLVSGRENVGGEQVLSVLLFADATLTELAPRRSAAQSPALAFGRLGGLLYYLRRGSRPKWLVAGPHRSRIRGQAADAAPRAFRVLPMAWVPHGLLP